MTADLDQLAAEAEAADQRAKEARATMREQQAADGDERTARDVEWLVGYLSTFDPAALRQNVADARAAVAEALHASELGRALLGLAVAERVDYSERAFAGHAALLAGLDPAAVTGHNPLIGSPMRNLTDPLHLLVEVLATEADRLTREHDAARQQARDQHGTDHGRINAAATHRQPILCAACDKPVAPDEVSYRNGGIAYHDAPACKPRPLFPTASSLADEEAQRLRLRKLEAN